MDLMMDLRKVAAAAALMLAAVAPALADPRDDALAAVAKCTSLTDDRARLACFDAAVPDVKAALAAPAPQVAETPKQEEESWFGLPSIFGGGGRPPQTTPQQFGNEYLPPPPPPKPEPGQPAPPPPPEAIDSITAGVSDYAFNPYGRFTVFLDNGQIWQQLPGDTDQAHFKKGGANKVTISRGAFGSYGLQVNDLNESFKVKRLK
jgi:hypothetical protein